MAKQILLMAGSAFLGALIAIILLAPTSLEAQGKRFSGLVEIFNTQKQRVAIMGPAQQGQGTVFLFNEKGKVTHQMSTYGGGAEKDQSLIGLHDKNEKLRYLFRLHGPNDSPVLVMKDKSGYDKIIIGLEGQNEQPYFKYLDAQGRMHNLLAP